MALSEKSRAVIYQQFHEMLGEEATQEMLSYFPARDVEEPVTKDYFRAESALMRSELRGEIAALRDEMHKEFRRLTLWMVTTTLAFGGILVAALH